MKITALKSLLIITTISLTTTVFAQKAAENLSSDTKKNNLPESVRQEIKNFHEKMRAINEECRKKREELKTSLSPDAKKAVEERRERMQKDRNDEKEASAQDKKPS
jgi:uncharacterized membrane protein YukC